MKKLRKEQEKKMKKILSVVLSLVLVFSMCLVFASCGSSDSGSSDEEVTEVEEGTTDDSAAASDEETIVLHLGSTVATTNAWYRAGETFAEDLAELSGGSLELQLDFGGVWGTDKENAEAVQNGSLDIYIGSTVGFDAIVTEIGYVNLPYLVTTYDQVDELIYNGWIGENVVANGEANGFKILNMTDCDFRWLTNSVHPIESGADLVNLKMRVPESPMFMNFFNELGAITTAMGITEVASSLQQGTIDGQDNGPVLSYTYGFYQFNEYVTASNHSFASAVIAMNPDKWDSLSASQQEALQTAADQYAENVITLSRADVDEMGQAMADEGCSVIDPTDQLYDDMMAAAQTVWYDDDVTDVFDQDAIARIREQGGAA